MCLHIISLQDQVHCMTWIFLRRWIKVLYNKYCYLWNFIWNFRLKGQVVGKANTSEERKQTNKEDPLNQKNKKTTPQKTSHKSNQTTKKTSTNKTNRKKQHLFHSKHFEHTDSMSLILQENSCVKSLKLFFFKTKVKRIAVWREITT